MFRPFAALLPALLGPTLLTAGDATFEVEKKLDLSYNAAKDAEIAIDHSTFRASSSISLRVEGTSTVRFCDNVSGEDSVVWVDKAVERSIPFFAATGNSNGPKAFQGNRIYPNEVRDQLLALPGVGLAEVVAVKSAEQTRLVAFVIPSAGAAVLLQVILGSRAIVSEEVEYRQSPCGKSALLALRGGQQFFVGLARSRVVMPVKKLGVCFQRIGCTGLR